MKFAIAVLTVWLGCSFAYATPPPDGLKIVMTTTDAKSVFTADPGHSDTFYENSKAGEQEIKVTGTGRMYPLNRDKKFDLAQQLPNWRSGEQSRVTLMRMGDRLGVLHYQTRMIVPNGLVPLDDLVEIELADGQWSDVDRGRIVTYHLTDKGVEQARRAQIDFGQKFISAFRSQLAEQGLEVLNLQIGASSEGRSVGTVSQKRLTVVGADGVITATMLVY